MNIKGKTIFAQLKKEVVFLKSVKTNIYSLTTGVFLLLSGVSFTVHAQNDSIIGLHQSQLLSNFTELSNLYCFSDSAFQPGKVRFASVTDFESEYSKLNVQLFPVLSDNAQKYFHYLNSLPWMVRENLIRMFSFYEKQFDAGLKSSGLPTGLKYIAPAISGLNINAADKYGSAGIWQLTHFQAVMNGLQVTPLVDERFSPELSTKAFAATMKQNFAAFETPELAVLGYLSGNTKVQNAIYFAGKNATLCEVIKFLPSEVNLFIASFQAMVVFLESNHFIPDVESVARRNVPDTVNISQQLHFQQVSGVLGIPQKQLEFLNPQYRLSIVPASAKKLKLALPDGYWDDFVLWQDSVYAAADSSMFEIMVQKIEYPPAPGRQYLGEPVKNLQIDGKTKLKYTLQSGDVLGIIAEKYDVRVEDLKYWNNIVNERKIQAGQTLDIFIDNDKVENYSGLQNVNKPKEVRPAVTTHLQQNSTLAVYQEFNNGKKLEHTVQNGESPFTIAKKYEGVSPEDILKWNNIDNARKIQIGQKLIIFTR